MSPNRVPENKELGRPMLQRARCIERLFLA